MIITNINRDAFLKAFQVVSGIVERKQPLPILSNVLITIDSDGIIFTSTDLEMQISSRLKLAELSNEFSMTVSAKKMYEILRVLPEKSLFSLENKNEKLIIKSGNSKFSLQTLPSQDFPKISEHFTDPTNIKLKQNLLKKLLSQVQYAMAQQDIRYYLNGLLVVLEENSIKLVATDGHRLAYSSAVFEGNYVQRELIISRKTVIELTKLLVDTDDPIEIQLTEKKLKILNNETELISKIIDGKFPDYQRVIPNYKDKIQINRLEFYQALLRASVLASEKFRGIRLIIYENTLKIISNNNEQEEAEEYINVDYIGSNLDIGFNVNYLLEGINSLNNEIIDLSFGNTNSSILISIPNENNFKYVVMPMRI